MLDGTRMMNFYGCLTNHARFITGHVFGKELYPGSIR